MSILKDVDLASKTGFLRGRACFSGRLPTEPTGIQNAKVAMAQRIAAEPAGDYYIGRRYFKPDFKFWDTSATEPALEHGAARDVE